MKIIPDEKGIAICVSGKPYELEVWYRSPLEIA